MASVTNCKAHFFCRGMDCTHSVSMPWPHVYSMRFYTWMALGLLFSTAIFSSHGPMFSLPQLPKRPILTSNKLRNGWHTNKNVNFWIGYGWLTVCECMCARVWKRERDSEKVCVRVALSWSDASFREQWNILWASWLDCWNVWEGGF